MAYTKIGFDAGLMSLRGTHVALFDYAFHNQQILGNESIVFYDQRSQQLEPTVFKKFKQAFNLIPYHKFSEIGSHADQCLMDAMYLIKSGERDAYAVPGVPNLVHAVFPQGARQKHGEVYAFVSRWLSEECSNGKIPFVPHVIHLPISASSLSEALSIPPNATVFGCYGGSDSFNLPFVKNVISEIVAKYPHIYFLYMNIDRFIDHPQVIFLPGNSDPEFKSQFINTCDAMLHARGIGESFGIACGEFSAHNKPVLTYALSPQRSHIGILGKRAMLYKGPKELRELILGFNKSWAKHQDWDCYTKAFSPTQVMQKFSSVFLDASLKSADIALSSLDMAAVQGARFRKKIRSLSRKLYP